MMKLDELQTALRGDWAAFELAGEQGFYATNLGNAIQVHVQGARLVHFALRSGSETARVVWQIDAGEWTSVALNDGVDVVLPDEQAHTVTVMLQTAAHLWTLPNGFFLMDVTVDAGEVTAVVDEQVRVAFIGDSITAGARILPNDENAPQLGYVAQVAAALGVTAQRFAYGGIGVTPAAPIQTPTAIDALWHVGPDLMRPRTQVGAVVVNLGTNDSNYGATEQQLRFGLRLLFLELVKRFHETPVLILTPFNGKMTAVYAQEAARFAHLKVIDTRDWHISPDRVHPNAAEHARAAKLLAPHLAAIL